MDTGLAQVISFTVPIRLIDDWFRYIALLGWSLAIWISWTPLIAIRQHVAGRGASAVGLVGRLLFAVFLCSAMLLFEKVLIQWIAQKFHEKSYAE